MSNQGLTRKFQNKKLRQQQYNDEEQNKKFRELDNATTDIKGIDAKTSRMINNNRKVCKNSFEKSARATTTTPTVIIGDTAAAVLYAYRKAVTNNQSNIILLCQGVDSLLNNPNITNLNFATQYYNNKADYFNPTRTAYIQQTDSGANDYDDLSQTECNFTFNPWGPLGDVVYQLIMDIGPWFNSRTKSNVQRKIDDQCIQTPYTAVETKVADYIKSTFNLQVSKSIIVKCPSVTYYHYYLAVQDNQNQNQIRNIFFQQYQDLILQSDNFTLYPQVVNLKFTEGTGSLFNVSFSSNEQDFEIDDCIVKWKTVPQQFQPLATMGGTTVKPSNTPVQYRAVIAMDKTDAGLDGATVLLDGTSSRVCFSLGNINQSKNKLPIGWMVTAYTTDYDVFSGQQADPSTNNTLLIVEAVAIGKNDRKYSFNQFSQELQVWYQTPDCEATYFENFQEIVTEIYAGYVGVSSTAPNVDQYILFTVDGKAVTQDNVTSIPNYMVQPYILLNLASNLYGLWYYNAPGFRNN